jgi:hypothetical protein
MVVTGLPLPLPLPRARQQDRAARITPPRPAPLPAPGRRLAPAPTPFPTPTPDARPGLLAAAVLALGTVAALFALQGRIDFSIDEEGFLWYGAVATAHGAVPLRDFYSYDPGRYYWAAAWSPLLGDGILGLRISTAAFASLGLFCGLLTARRLVSSRAALALTAAMLALWMVPRNKQFEPAIELAAVLAAQSLLELPSPRRCLMAGATQGLALFFGKNHGLYLAAAFVPLFWVALAWSPEARAPGGLRTRLMAALTGCAIGAAPLLLMLAAVPGFARAYLDSVLLFIRQGRTNFPLPIPWPWRLDDAVSGLVDRAQWLGAGTCFLILPAVAAAAAATALLGGRRLPLHRRATLLACGVIGLAYLHHAFSRADVGHLAEGAAPSLLGLLALPGGLADRSRRRIAAAVAGAVLILLTVTTAVPAAPLFQALTPEGPGDKVEPCDVGGDTLLVDRHTARFLRGVARTIAQHVPPDEPILLAPCLPGLYPFLHRRAPVYEVYALWSGPLDDRLLHDLKAADVRWALVQDYSMDDRDELRFHRTHPKTWAYLTAEFERLPGHGLRLPGRAFLLHKRGPSPPASHPELR